MVKKKNWACPPTPKADRPLSQYHSNSGYTTGQVKSREILAEVVGELLLRIAAGQAESDTWQVFKRLLRFRWERKQL